MADSNLEAQLAFQLRVRGITGWSREVVFAPPRRWRADFLFEEPRKLIVEVQGGLWGGTGRHSRMEGATNDARKAAVAQMMGYRVLYITPLMLDNAAGHGVSEAITLIEEALGLGEAKSA